MADYLQIWLKLPVNQKAELFNPQLRISLFWSDWKFNQMNLSLKKEYFLANFKMYVILFSFLPCTIISLIHWKVTIRLLWLPPGSWWCVVHNHGNVKKIQRKDFYTRERRWGGCGCMRDEVLEITEIGYRFNRSSLGEPLTTIIWMKK